MNSMTPTTRDSMNRWLSGLLLAPLAVAAPTPAFALRAAGLEENGARQEVARELGVPEDAGPRAQLLASSNISNSHVYATALGYGAKLLINAHRATAITSPVVPQPVLPPSAPPTTQPTGLEEPWEQEVTVFLDQYDAMRATPGLHQIPSSAAIQKILERSDMDSDSKRSSVVGQVLRIREEGIRDFRGSVADRALFTQPLTAIVLFLMEDRPSSEQQRIAAALHLLEAYEYFRKSVQPASFETLVPNLSGAEGALRTRDLDGVRARVQTAERAVSEAVLPLDTTRSRPEAQVLEATFRQFQTLLRTVLNRALAVLPTTGLEEGAQLAAMLRGLETTPVSLQKIIGFPSSATGGRAASLLERSVGPAQSPALGTPIYRLWGFDQQHAMRGWLLNVGVEKGAWIQPRPAGALGFSPQAFTASEMSALSGAQVAVTDASGTPLFDHPWMDLEPSSNSSAGWWEATVPLPQDFALTTAFLSVRLPLATTSAKIYYTTAAAGRRLAQLMAVAEQGGDPTVSMAPDTIALQAVAPTAILPAGSLMVTVDQAEATWAANLARLLGRQITAVPLAEVTSLAALLQRLSDRIPRELPAGTKLLVEHHGDALRIYL